jgi:hypothetical protein
MATAEHAKTKRVAPERSTLALRKPVPGRLFRWVKIVSWFESCLFAALLFFWIAPGYGSQTGLFGLLHGIGYLGLCALVFVALLRHEAPWPLFAATLTPIGPFGTVIAIELIERKGWGIERPEAAGIDRGKPTRKNQSRREDVLT